MLKDDQSIKQASKQSIHQPTNGWSRREGTQQQQQQQTNAHKKVGVREIKQLELQPLRNPVHVAAVTEHWHGAPKRNQSSVLVLARGIHHMPHLGACGCVRVGA